MRYSITVTFESDDKETLSDAVSDVFGDIGCMDEEVEEGIINIIVGGMVDKEK